MSLIFALLIQLLFSNRAWAGYQQAPVQASQTAAQISQPTGFSKITAIIDARARAQQPITSINELLPLIPKEFTKRFTLIYKTESRLQDASPIFPRAVMSDGNTTLTFNGSPSQLGYNTLEVLEFDKVTRKFEFREIIEPATGATTGLTYSTSTPSKCLGCHGSDPKPIWDPYNEWPRIYGSNDDDLGKDEQEAALYKTFIKSVKEAPSSRYRILGYPFNNGNATYPYNQTPYVFTSDFAKRPNLIFADQFSYYNAYRVARIIQEKFTSLQDRELVLFLLLAKGRFDACDGYHVDQYTENIKRYFGYQEGRQSFDNHYSTDGWMMGALGLSHAVISIQKGYTHYGPYNFDGISGDLLPEVAAVLYHDLEKWDPSLLADIPATPVKGLLESDYITLLGSPLWYMINKLRVNFNDYGQKGCANLELKLQNYLKNPKSHVPALYKKTGDDFIDKLQMAELYRASDSVPVSCTYCHSVDSRAPRIPFNNGVKLRELVQTTDLADQIMSRIATNAHNSIKMPPVSDKRFPDLNPNEIKNFSDYLEALKKNW